ncbi:MAG: LysM peptidoglycan-binding domain-containing protein [Bacteroidia bacterium]|nr:LysM peptidoglycan-binding domain-containing protein [Bacteroidia bacterium]
MDGILVLSPSLPAQELRVETQGGQKYILYKVQPKETVFSISQKYDLTQERLIELNPSAADVLKVGQVLRLPYDANEVVNPKILTSPNTEDAIRHKVKPGEWLSQIARDYQVEVEDIRKWNELNDDVIKPGQELIVGIGTSKSKKKNNMSEGTLANNTGNTSVNKDAKKTSLKTGLYPPIKHKVQPNETLFSLQRQYNVPLDQIKEWNNLSDNTIKVGQELTLYVNPTNTPGTITNPTGTMPTGTNPNPTGGNNGSIDPFDQLSNAQNGNQSNTSFQTYPSTTPGSNGNQLAPGPGVIQHTVKEGQSLYALRNLYHVSQPEIQYWNKMAPDDVTIHPGEILTIYQPQALTHIVKPGENLNSIANFYQVSPNSLVEWNKLTSGTGGLSLQTGQPLKNL